MAAKILLVEDEETFTNAFLNAFSGDGFEIQTAENSSAALLVYHAEGNKFDAVVIDLNLPDISGDELAKRIARENPEQEIVFATGDLRSEALTQLLLAGVGRGFIAKGSSTAELKRPVLEAIQRYQREKKTHGGETRARAEIEEKLATLGLVGRSAAMYGVYRKIQKLKNSYALNLKTNVLVLGETGTGKEQVVKGIVSGLGKRIYSINCAKYEGNEQFLESELFGHVKGAFTGADRDRAGILENANGHFVFFDEIHCLTLNAQAKLLRVLQERKIRRLGDTSDREIDSDFYLVSAAKPDLFTRTQNKQFLLDLYYRISSFEIALPTLRERAEDIEPLTEHFLRKLRSHFEKDISFRAKTIRVMETYSWPGNVRELENVVERLVVDSDRNIIEPSDFRVYVGSKEKLLNLSDEISFLDLGSYLRLAELEYIKSILKQSTSQVDAARKMGVPRSTLGFRLRRLHINPDEFFMQETSIGRT